MKRPTAGRVLTYVVLGLWSIVCLLPVYWLGVTSLKSPALIDDGPFYIPFIDFQPVTEAWSFILRDSDENLLASLLNSALVAMSATLLAMTAGAMAAYALTRFSYAAVRKPSARFNAAIMSGLLATRLLPPVALALPLTLMAWHARLQDSRLFLTLTYAAINLPVALWLVHPVLGPKATEQEEAARLDGASHATLFFSILLPMVTGGVVAAGLIVFVLCWNEYLLAAYLAGGHSTTVPVWLLGQLSMKEAQTASEAEEAAHFSAAAVLLLLPLVVFAGVVQRALSRTARLHGRN